MPAPNDPSTDGSTRRPAGQVPLRAVVLDVGETLVDETRAFGAWADWIGVPRLTFGAVLGAVIERGGDHREVFGHFVPGFDLARERGRRAAAGVPESFHEKDLYPDARPCLSALRDQGLFVGIAGNQPAEAEEVLRSWDLPADLVAASEAWGVGKPDPAFFAKVVDAAGCPAASVLYVGDRFDNDVRAPQDAGLATAWIKRGPWGFVQHDAEALSRALFSLTTLAELPALVAEHNARHGSPPPPTPPRIP
jgi:FMN phosphatase YigB (HAD superfamily)